MNVVVLGVQKGKSKNGRDFTRIFYKKLFGDYEVENSDCSGMMTGSEFSYKDFNVKPGDECDFHYEPGFRNEATLSDVVVLKPAVEESVKAAGGK